MLWVPARAPAVTLVRVPDARMLRGATAGAAAAAVWAAQEPLDIRVFRVSYSDPKLLAKPIGGSRLAGVPIHLVNGAVLGAIYQRLTPRHGVLPGVVAGLAEHLATWPLTRFLPGVKLWGNHRAFCQAVWRHLLFGAILGAVEARLAQLVRARVL